MLVAAAEPAAREKEKYLQPLVSAENALLPLELLVCEKKAPDKNAAKSAQHAGGGAAGVARGRERGVPAQGEDHGAWQCRASWHGITSQDHGAWQCRASWHGITSQAHGASSAGIVAWQHTIISPGCWQCRRRGSSSYH